MSINKDFTLVLGSVNSPDEVSWLKSLVEEYLNTNAVGEHAMQYLPLLETHRLRLLKDPGPAGKEALNAQGNDIFIYRLDNELSMDGLSAYEQFKMGLTMAVLSGFLEAMLGEVPNEKRPMVDFQLDPNFQSILGILNEGMYGEFVKHLELTNYAFKVEVVQIA